MALAFAAGMVATVNPCGFSLLPAYIGAFVAGDSLEDRVDRRILRAVGVAAAVSLGFVLVFATAGLIIDGIAGEARRRLPWITIVIGVSLMIAGIATVAGWRPGIALRGPRPTIDGGGVRVMVGYGITYAIASLSCTLGPFLAVTGTALARSPMEGLASYVAYALGMGLIIVVLSVASALAHATVANHLRRLSRLAPTVGGVLMVLAGAYAVWYGRWELAVYGGRIGTDPVIDGGESVRLWLVRGIEGVGAVRLAAVVALALMGAVGAIRLTRGPSDDPPIGPVDGTGSRRDRGA